jgi:hypothetical protein
MTLSEVIDRALMNYRAMVIVGDERARDGQGPYIAAAVAAHLTSEAVVERLARGIYESTGNRSPWNGGDEMTKAAFIGIAGAAIRAALGCDDA